jgi:preprotein translocase subunit SecE
MAAGSKQLAANGKAAKRAADGPATWLPRLQTYVEELKREMRLVTWPNRAQVRSTTLVVLVTVFAFAVFFGVVDFLLASGQTALYQYFR